jgi:flagellar biosynthesis chaperone FliJ
MLDKELLVTTGIPSTNVEIEQQKEHIRTLAYLLDLREDERREAENNYERAFDMLKEAKFKLYEMEDKIDQN